ncbi:hypothetical protein FKM82_029302 [Ascaphus truei]
MRKQHGAEGPGFAHYESARRLECTYTLPWDLISMDCLTIYVWSQETHIIIYLCSETNYFKDNIMLKFYHGTIRLYIMNSITSWDLSKMIPTVLLIIYI